MFELFANSGDPDQMPCSAASDLGLHCLPITLLGLSRLQCVNCHLQYKVIVSYSSYIVTLNTVTQAQIKVAFKR